MDEILQYKCIGVRIYFGRSGGGCWLAVFFGPLVLPVQTSHVSVVDSGGFWIFLVKVRFLREAVARKVRFWCEQSDLAPPNVRAKVTFIVLCVLRHQQQEIIRIVKRHSKKHGRVTTFEEGD